MKLPIARLLVKAAKWLAPRIKDEIANEVQRKVGSREPGMDAGPLNPEYRRSDSFRPPTKPPG